MLLLFVLAQCRSAIVIRRLFGGFVPSAGNSTRACKLAKAEWYRQARLYRLEAQILSNGGSQATWRTRLEYKWTSAQSTELFWTQHLIQLRDDLSKKPKRSRSTVHTLEPLDLPEDASQVLSLAPKFAVEPKPSPPQLLSMVRKMLQHVTHL